MSKQNNAEAVSGDRQKGSFEVSSNHQPATQPVPPPATGDQVAPHSLEHQAAPQEERLPWILFKLGFFLPLAWYIGAIMLCCSKRDRREKHGLVACAIAACIYAVLVVIIVSVYYRNAHN